VGSSNQTLIDIVYIILLIFLLYTHYFIDIFIDYILLVNA
jgi:hypothetical protein